MFQTNDIQNWEIVRIPETIHFRNIFIATASATVRRYFHHGRRSICWRNLNNEKKKEKKRCVRCQALRFPYACPG